MLMEKIDKFQIIINGFLILRTVWNWEILIIIKTFLTQEACYNERDL